jgi:hypothetical protein
VGYTEKGDCRVAAPLAVTYGRAENARRRVKSCPCLPPAGTKWPKKRKKKAPPVTRRGFWFENS